MSGCDEIKPYHGGNGKQCKGNDKNEIKTIVIRAKRN